MEAERAVHRRLFGLPEATQPVVSTALSAADIDADPLASVLF